MRCHPVLLLLAATAVHAAPTAEPPAPAPAPQVRSDDEALPDSTRTLRALLEPAQRVRPSLADRDGDAAPPRKPPVLQPPAVDASGLMSETAKPAPRHAPAALDDGADGWTEPVLDPTAGLGLAQSPAAAAAALEQRQDYYAPGTKTVGAAATGDSVNVRQLLPPELVQFIRNNREWVLFGSLGIVAGLWLLGAGAARGRR